MYNLSKSFDRISDSAWLIRITVFFLLSVITISTFLYYLAGRSGEKDDVSQALLREVILADSGARSIENLFKDKENELSFFSIMPSMADPKGPFVANLLQEKLEKSAGTPISDVIRVDAEGDVVARGSGISGVANVADRDYFIWAKDDSNKGKVFYSKVTIARGGPDKGKKVIALAAPVYKDKEFTGVVAFVISIAKLTDYYLSPLEVTANSFSLLIIEDGTVIAPKMGKLGGEPITDLIDIYAENKKDARETLDKIEKGQSGVATLTFKEPTLGNTVRLVAYAPVKLAKGKLIWSLLSTVPKEEALSYFYPSRVQESRATAVGIIMAFVVTACFIFVIRLSQRKGYLEGFAKGRDHGEHARGTPPSRGVS